MHRSFEEYHSQRGRDHGQLRVFLPNPSRRRAKRDSQQTGTIHKLRRFRLGHYTIHFFSMFRYSCFLSFMNLFDMSIQNPFLRKLLPQLLHLNGFFPSWPDLMYSFRFTFWIKLLSQMLHFNGFFPSLHELLNSICPFICLFCEQLASQILHLNGFFPSWAIKFM